MEDHDTESTGVGSVVASSAPTTLTAADDAKGSGEAAAAAAAAAAGGGGGGDAAEAGTDSAPRLPSKHKQAQCRGDDGRGKRPRKGDAKRERKKKALAQAAETCQYYVDDAGLRRVRPYIYEFQTYTKERWLERALIDVFAAEFAGEPRSHYENAIRSGLLTVNGEKVGLDYKLQNSDLICNRTHRHEPPVCGGDIEIVSESADELVVNKPCTVPIHPCGSYRFNTLFYILRRQRPDLSLRVCHRLDRLTSGLTILAKTPERAGVIQKQIGSGATRKTYLARVSGDFGQRLSVDRRQPGSPPSPAEAAAAASSAPANDGSSSLPSETGDSIEPSPVSYTSGSTAAVVDGTGELWWRYEPLGEGVVKDPTRNRLRASSENGETRSDGGRAAKELTSDRGGSWRTGGDQVMVRVNCPIRALDPKHGVYECHPLGKEAQTAIRKVEYDAASDTSIVECSPVHGRTHQIRLHLQWTGHPIANDPCYGGELHFGNPEAKRRADENPASEGWKGVSAKSEAGTEEPVGGGGHSVAGSSRPPGATSSLGTNGAPQHEVAVPRSADDSASAAAEELGSPPTLAVPGYDTSAQREGEDDEAFMVRTCSMCQNGERFKETQLHCVGIWLHALRYEGPDWAFETEIPSWASF
eukprot:g17580.t1